MEFIDLSTQQQLIKADIDHRIQAVLRHGQYIMGPEVEELENQLASRVGVEHCLAVSSGTDALLIALLAIGVGAGDEVIVPAFSFIATAEVVCLLGAKPVFVDVEKATGTISCCAIEKALTSKTKAVIPVSLYGQCAAMESINSLARAAGITVIEDAAQSLGALHHGRSSCGLSMIACTSFFPSKPLGCYGDGGACFTNDDDIAQKIREIRVHGQSRRYYHARLGLNGRMDTLQAAILLAKISIFDDEIVKRQQIASRYNRLLADIPGLETPSIMEGNTHVYAQYTLQVKNRDALADELRSMDIPTAVHYPVPLHRQPALSVPEDQHLVSEELCASVLSLPMHPYLDSVQQDQVVKAIRSFF